MSKALWLVVITRGLFQRAGQLACTRVCVRVCVRACVFLACSMTWVVVSLSGSVSSRELKGCPMVTPSVTHTQTHTHTQTDAHVNRRHSRRHPHGPCNEVRRIIEGLTQGRRGGTKAQCELPRRACPQPFCSSSPGSLPPGPARCDPDPSPPQ